jgi:hemerythrin-like domain-containing protein
MQPIGPLMIEHRLIERMIALLGRAADSAEEKGDLDGSFVAAAVDFIRAYADRTHHGKEEDILFKDLAARGMMNEDERVMLELIDEHRKARRIVGQLVAAEERRARGDADALGEVVRALRDLVALYPSHILKEDRRFFPASMTYMDEEEKSAMLSEMYDFDRKMIHEKYAAVVERESAKMVANSESRAGK